MKHLWIMAGWVTHQTRIKVSLHVQNDCNNRKINQHTIRRARPTGEKEIMNLGLNKNASY